MPRVPVRVLEPEPALAEVHLARDAGVHHPLQRAVDGGAADAMILVADQIDQIVGAQVAFLAQEDVDDEVALARALAARGPEPIEIGRRGSHHVGTAARRRARGRDLDAEGLAAAAGRDRVRVLDREAAAGHGIDEVDLGALQVAHADRIDVAAERRCSRRSGRPSLLPSSIIRPYWKPEQPPPWTNTRNPLPSFCSSASSSEIFAGRCRGYVDHLVSSPTVRL